MAAQEVLNGGAQTAPPGWTEPPTDGGGDGGNGGGDGGNPGLPPASDLCDGSGTGPFPHPDDCSK